MLIAIGVLLALATFGQQDPVYRADTRLVVLHTTVADRSGKLIAGLPQKAFKIYENNIEQQIRIFRGEDIPVSIGLIIDNSGSMKDKREKVAASALQLVKASNAQDQVFIVNFNDEAYLDCPFTNSISKLEEGLSRIDQRGGTAMRDAIAATKDYDGLTGVIKGFNKGEVVKEVQVQQVKGGRFRYLGVITDPALITP